MSWYNNGYYNEEYESLRKDIEKKKLDDLRKDYLYLLLDSCDTDTQIRKSVEDILGVAWLEGDSMYVPDTIAIVEELVSRIKALESKLPSV